MEIKPFSRKIWLSTPTMHGDELRYMQEAYETNWMSTVGENIDIVEKLTREQVGCAHAVALSSGTAALHLAVKLAGVRPGERVFCSDMTFAATANPVVYEGGEPVFIDTEYGTWNMDPEALAAAFVRYPETRVVMLAHLYGTPARMDEIRAVCREHKAILIEDAAESLGASYDGKQTGMLGDIGVVSFNGNKIITGSAGGMLLTNDGDAAARVRKWGSQGKEETPWYQHEVLGYNYRMSNVIAGVIRGQYAYLSDHMARKVEIYERYRHGFRDLPVCMNPYDTAHSQPNFWLSCLLIDREAMCEQRRGERSATYTSAPGKSCPTEILEKLAAAGVEGRPIWKPLHVQPLYEKQAFVPGAHCPAGYDSVSMDIFARGLCLPSDIKMTPAEQDAVIELVRSCFA